MSSKNIIIIAGESSGDMHAAHLVSELSGLDPTLKFYGLGGPKMKDQGVEVYQDLTEIAVVGFFEVIRHFQEFKKAFYLILQKIKEIKPAAVILVDYPGFNLRLAKKIKKLGVKVIYYISPQVWAWKKNRVKIIKKYVDLMLVLFQFEKDFYTHLRMKAVFVGHPLVDLAKVSLDRKTFLESLGLENEKLTIGLLPGSRQKEIEIHLPLMLQAAYLLHQEFPRMQFLVIKANTIKKSLLEKYTLNSALNVRIIENQSCEAIHASDACLVASGTATLETAVLGCPMVIVYKTSFLTGLLARLLIKVPYIGMVNIVAGRKIVPECVQSHARPAFIVQELKKILSGEEKTNQIKSDLKWVKESLGPEGASRRAAEEILTFLNN